MAAPDSLTVTLPRDLAAFVRERVADGTFPSASALVAEAIVGLQDRVLLRAAKLADLRAAIQVGVEQADRGELVDGEAVMERLLAELEAD